MRSRKLVTVRSRKMEKSPRSRLRTSRLRGISSEEESSTCLKKKRRNISERPEGGDSNEGGRKGKESFRLSLVKKGSFKWKFKDGMGQVLKKTFGWGKGSSKTPVYSHVRKSCKLVIGGNRRKWGTIIGREKTA